MMNLIRIFPLALLIVANPAVGACNSDLFALELEDKVSNLQKCVEEQQDTISLQAMEISNLNTEVGTLQLQQSSNRDDTERLKFLVSTLEMEIDSIHYQKNPASKRKGTPPRPEDYGAVPIPSSPTSRVPDKSNNNGTWKDYANPANSSPNGGHFVPDAPSK